MPYNTPFTVLVVDDHALVREAFTSLIKSEFPHATVLSAGSCSEALVLAREQTFEVAMVDIELGDRSGLELTTELRSLPIPPRIIAVSMHQEETFVTRTLQLGARAYVAKDAPPGELFEAIRSSLEGNLYI